MPLPTRVDVHPWPSPCSLGEYQFHSLGTFARLLLLFTSSHHFSLQLPGLYLAADGFH